MSATSPASAATTRGRAITIEVLAVLLGTGLIAVLITWPLAMHFGSNVLGGDGSASDTMGYWWDIWNNHANGLDLWGGGVQDHIGFPFGRPIVGSGNLTLLVFTGPAWLIASFASAAATLNTLALAGMALSGAAMYLLIRWLGLGLAVAAWAAVAFELAPYEMLRAAAHVPLAHLEWAPLLLMAGIAWVRRPGARAAILLAAATLLGWLTNPYYGAMASAMAGVIVLVGLVILICRHESWRPVATRVVQAVGALVVLVGIPVAAMLVASRGATETVTRQRVELEIYGARVWDYIIPPPSSRLANAIVGPGGLDPVRSPGGERMVFLGWVVILLALVGIAWGIRRRHTLTTTERTALAVALPVAVVMGLVSMASPTRILGLEIPMPSSLVFDYLPYLRTYARFGVAVLASTLVLAALGLALIIRNRSTLVHHCWIAGAIILTAVEMPVAMPIGSGPPILVEGNAPADVATWRWLRDHDGTAPVIEVPAFTSEDTDRYYLAGQTVHGHLLANGGLNEQSATADFGEEYGSPLFRAAPSAYATTGIRLVAVEPWAYRQRGLTPPNPSAPPQGLALLRAFPDGSAIWRVTARPLPAIAFPERTTWDPPRTVNGMRWRYMRDTAVMRVYAPRATRVTVRFLAHGISSSLTYPLEIITPGGHVRHVQVHGRIPVSFTTALPAGTSTFTLIVSRPPGDPLGPEAMTVETSQWVLSSPGM